eukprot:TRINITY_DN15277_c1_g1_i1.p1 TRINITY_DN15277_c1_g1~~TRINITY_DN15277_c1_g1_i1.p1  ORF type:complete len:242 (+),score=50.26 TRINITY_DN15277_c1_g1_i1:103-726(+)
MISKTCGVPFVSMGKVLKERMPEEVKAEMIKGKLAPVWAVEEVFRGMRKEFEGGFILDGFPRSLEQVEILKRVAADTDVLRPDYALHFKMKKEYIIRKLLGRRECDSCGANWNLAHIEEDQYYMPAILPPDYNPSNPRCSCGAHLHPRGDDTATTIATRLDTHERNWATLEEPLRAFLDIYEIEIMGGSEIMWPSIGRKIDQLSMHA